MFRQLQALFGIVLDAQLDEQVGEPHHSQPDPAGLLAHLLDFFDGVVVHVDYVVQEMDGCPHHTCQPVPIDRHVTILIPDHAGQVNRSQVAGLKRQQGLLATRIGALDLSQLRIGVVVVDQVQEDQTGVSGLPGHLHRQFKNLAGVLLANYHSGTWVDQVVFLTRLHPFHEVPGYADGDVEVIQVLAVFFGPDESPYIRMVYVENAHVGAPAGAALLNHVGGGVKCPDKANRTAGDPPGGANHVARRTQARKGETRPPAALMNQSRLLDLVEDRVQGVVDRQYEASGKLLQLPAGVHQGG